LVKAREASAIEHERTMESLKRARRLVVDTTAKVAESNTEDQQRPSKKQRQVA
jgi:hypothetical protein